jgi:flagellar biosynthesis protein FlhG
MNLSSTDANPWSPSDLAPARMQFIEQAFADLLSPAASALGQPRAEIVRWVHQRLFVDMSPVGNVRLELHQCCRRCRLMGVTSGKGGVGKTTVSVNLAISFAALGKRVLLCDADLGLANVHVFAGVNPSVTILDVLDGRSTLANAVVQGPGGIHMICGASGISRLADLSTKALETLGQHLVQLAASYDVLLIDTGAGIGSSVMQFLKLVQDIVLVSTPNLAATLDAYGVIKMARETRLGAEFHLLLNQADDETQARQAATRISGAALRFLQYQPQNLGYLQRDAAMEAASFARQPLVLSRPDHVNAQRLASIAATLLGVSVPASRDAADEAA